jgi:hypothetical protein
MVLINWTKLIATKGYDVEPKYFTTWSTSSSRSLVDSWAPRSAASRRNYGVSDPAKIKNGTLLPPCRAT